MRQEFIPGDYDVTRKHSVVPLPVLSKNEQCYTDVIQILDSYEETVAEIFKASGKVFDGKTKVHIGGDQLTRERFSGAKRLRKDAITEEERFEHLSPITFELFHLQMTLLTISFTNFYTEKTALRKEHSMERKYGCLGLRQMVTMSRITLTIAKNLHFFNRQLHSVCSSGIFWDGQVGFCANQKFYTKFR